MDHEQKDERFVRRTWSAPPQASPSPAGGGCAGVDTGVVAGDALVDSGGPSEGFRVLSECSCLRCATERLAKACEEIERHAPSCPSWDADLVARVWALDAQVYSEQELDRLHRLYSRSG